MYNEILQSMEGIAIYPMISLIVFLLFFVSLFIWVLKSDKKYMSKMSRLPLESCEIIKKSGGYDNDNA
jgi:cytochrome c oxidase cbb3-type subunit 4